MLGRAVCEHWPALVRDVLALGYQTVDMFTTLSVAEMSAIVVAAPPGSSLRYFFDDGWTREAHLLANQQERDAGLVKLQEPYVRPGLEDRGDWGGDNKLFHSDAMTWEEMDEKNRKRYAYADELAAKGIKSTNTRVRVL